MYEPIEACWTLFGRFYLDRDSGTFRDRNSRIIGNCEACGHPGFIGEPCPRAFYNHDGTILRYCGDDGYTCILMYLPDAIHSIDPTIIELCYDSMYRKLRIERWWQSTCAFPITPLTVPYGILDRGGPLFPHLAYICALLTIRFERETPEI